MKYQNSQDSYIEIVDILHDLKSAKELARSLVRGNYPGEQVFAGMEESFVNIKNTVIEYRTKLENSFVYCVVEYERGLSVE
jgi:hypothetical protein